MTNKLAIQLASAGQAEAISALLIRSISELCVDDHQNKPEKLHDWLWNKTPSHVEQWLVDAKLVVYSAMLDTELAGVGMISHAGNIMLCYALPEFIGHGVGKALMKEFERFALTQNIDKLTLESTLKAKPFYQSQGFKSDNSLDCRGSVSCLRMSKALQEKY